MNKYRILSIFVVLAMVFSFANVSPASAATTAVTLQEGTATFSQNGFSVDAAIDGLIGPSGWAIDPNQGADQTAVWETSSDIDAVQLDFELHQVYGSNHTLGRFRLSYTTDDRSLFADGSNSAGSGALTGNWTVLTGATISGTGGETFTVLGDNSILVSGNNPATSVYIVSFAGSFTAITGIRLEALSDASLSSNGPGRQPNGNFVLSEITLDATYPNPLDDAGWELVAHMSNSGGMFDGNGELMPGYSYGTFVPNPVSSTPDFQRAFPVVADKILFITGDSSIWAIADYGDLRTLIDARAGVFPPNLAFETGVNGVISNTTGNVLSRLGVNEDPWISMEGDHSYGVYNQRIVWGENNYNNIHVNLKNNHGGINVYVKAADNASPTANAGGSYSGNEGTAIAMNGATASDPNLDTLTYAWTVDSASCSFNDASALNPELTCSDNGSYTATLSVDDGVNPAVSSDATVTVSNVAPTLGAISVDMALVPVNTTINASATFTDPGTLDIHAASWDWGDGTSAGNVTQGAGFGTVDDSHSYSVPGVYTLKLTVTDNDSDVSNESVYQYVVVYDPSGGFVTGGGWIDSPAGAYKADESLSGKATFGFVAKYKKGATVPDGNTEFQFKAGDLNFKSTSYEWLVVAGSAAQFKGEGTINGQGSYMFKIWADDDNPDTFRIMIWGDSGVVYDNGSQQSLGGGSIKVHNK